ncbi:MAG: class I SAM-dependent methyltransferase [Pirellula sp.]
MSRLASGVRYVVSRLAAVPAAFDALRWFLEGGFLQHKQLLRKHFPDPSIRILDCGCGTGIHAKHFSREGYVGIDLSPKYIERANQKFPGYRFCVMDATQLQFESQSFDAVIVSGVVHHLDDPTTARVFSEIRRVLKRDGTFLLWEDIPTRHILNFVGWAIHRLDIGEHIRPFTAYGKLLENYFNIESTEEFRSGFMDYVAFRSRIALH